MLPEHFDGLTPRSPVSLKDSLILLPRLFSGPRGIRTLGLLNAIETRSQLRYGPKNVARIVLANQRFVNQTESYQVDLEGFEPSASSMR